MNENQEKTTHFGYKTVAENDKASMVADVFHSVAAKYDVMNDLMSFGIHRLWKRQTIASSGVRKGHYVLDLAGGTGDLTAKFSQLVGETGQVILGDINSSMLKVGREKLRNLGRVGNIEYVQMNAEALPFPDNSFDLITIAFGLRNVTDKDKAFESNRLKGLSLEELFDEYQYWNSESQRVFDLGEGETLVKDWLSKMYEKLGLKKEPEGKETELLKGSNYYPPQE